jgi:CHASE2 domain-containing sensor protein
MDINNLMRLANNFFQTHTLLVIAGAAALIIIICLKPKTAFKFLLVVLGVAVAGYLLYYIGGAALSGMAGKKQMITP